MTDTSTINIWLGILAIATLLQTLFMFGVAFIAWRSARQVREVADRIERQHVEPLVARVNAAIDDVRDMAARARTMDDNVRSTVASATSTARDAADRVAGTVWPAYALGRAVYTTVASFLRGPGSVAGHRR